MIGESFQPGSHSSLPVTLSVTGGQRKRFDPKIQEAIFAEILSSINCA